MIAAGRLRHQVKLQAPSRAQDPVSGAMEGGWVDVDTIWAEVVPLSAREFVAGQALQNEVVARITIRYRADVTPKHRLVHGAAVYNIEGVLPDPVSGREYLTLPVSAGINDG